MLHRSRRCDPPLLSWKRNAAWEWGAGTHQCTVGNRMLCKDEALDSTGAALGSHCCIRVGRWIPPARRWNRNATQEYLESASAPLEPECCARVASRWMDCMRTSPRKAAQKWLQAGWAARKPIYGRLHKIGSKLDGLHENEAMEGCASVSALRKDSFQALRRLETLRPLGRTQGSATPIAQCSLFSPG